MTSATPEVLVSSDDEELANAVAARLVTRIAELQERDRIPSVVLTGGSIAVKIHEAVVASPAQESVDWSRVDFWFGDERFVPAGDPERNLGQAAKAMLDHLPVDPDRVHAMAASDGPHGDDVEAAAAAYADQLRAADSSTGTSAALFDVLMLGIGPDGHCASLFPGHPAVHEQAPAVAVHDAPKPPPTRISLSMGTLQRADEIWWVAAGSEKAQAVHDAISGTDPMQLPASGPKGLSRTLWMLDSEAAAQL